MLLVAVLFIAGLFARGYRLRHLHGLCVRGVAPKEGEDGRGRDHVRHYYNRYLGPSRKSDPDSIYTAPGMHEEPSESLNLRIESTPITDPSNIYADIGGARPSLGPAPVGPIADAFVGACTRGDSGAVSAALARTPALANAVSTDGRSALAHAIMIDAETVVASIVNAGADVNGRDKLGTTAIMFASRLGNASIIAQLARAGADVTKGDAKGLSPLHHAALAGSASGVSALLAAGANPLAVDARNNTPRAIATMRKRVDIASLLAAAEADRS